MRRLKNVAGGPAGDRPASGGEQPALGLLVPEAVLRAHHGHSDRGRIRLVGLHPRLHVLDHLEQQAVGLDVSRPASFSMYRVARSMSFRLLGTSHTM